MIDRNHELPIKRQAELMGISRGNVYYLARTVSEAEQRLMRRIDELHLEHPVAGARMLRDMLNRGGAGNLNTAISGTLCEINPGLRARESRMDHEQETPQEPLTAVQGQGGGGRHQGREDVGRAGQVARCAPQPDR